MSIIITPYDDPASLELRFDTARNEAGGPLEPFQGARRMTVTPTIDGGVVVYDAGYVAEGLLTINKDVASADQMNTADLFLRIYPEVRVTMAHGAWRAYFESFSSIAGKLQISLQVVERLT